MPNLGLHSSFGHSAAATSPLHALASGFGGRSPFTASAWTTSSQVVPRPPRPRHRPRPRRDGPSLALSHNPSSTDPYRPTRPTDFVPNTTPATASRTGAATTNSSATAAATSQTTSQQRSHFPLFPQPSARTAPQILHHQLHDDPDDDPLPAYMREPNNDDFLEALATADYSSPSLPPRSPQSPTHHRSQQGQLLDHSALRQSALPSDFAAARRLSHTGTGFCKVEDHGYGDDLSEEERTAGSPHAEMPITRKRSRAGAAAASSPGEQEVGAAAPKRRRTAVVQRAATPGRSRNTPRPAASRNYTPAPAVAIDSDEDSLFGGMDIYDLTKSDDAVPQELFQPVKDSSIKLSSFECVICMDAATNLTVTCCGMSCSLAWQELPVCTNALLIMYRRSHVLCRMPPPSHAYRSDEKDLSDVSPAPGQAVLEIQTTNKGFLPPRVETQTIQEVGKTTRPALIHLMVTTH
jgi:hypothetical protein